MTNHYGYPAILILLMACAESSNCNGQVVSSAEERMPKDLRNQMEVELILEKLRFLRDNESKLGENHLKKKSVQVQIREHEAELELMVANSKMKSDADAKQSSIKAEDTLPKEMLKRMDVQLIVERLRFMRMNESYFGENHPSKRSIREQIRKQEVALATAVKGDGLTAPKLAVEANQGAEEVWPLAASNVPEIRGLVKKLLFLKVNATSFSEKDPNRLLILEQMNRLEAIYLSQSKNSSPRSLASDLAVRPNDVSSTPKDMQYRREVRTVVEKLTALRFNERQFGENHPSWVAIQNDIREQETALKEYIDQYVEPDASIPIRLERSTK